MIRSIEENLGIWRASSNRRPLILRGARQVGKTYTVREFARRHFKRLVEINFELVPHYKKIFSSLQPQEIIANINLTLDAPITPGDTLLFFDEVQACPQAIAALRYFFEQMPELHVIAAGSLIEFVLAAETFSMPVGRVEYRYLHPMTFIEFLRALGKTQLVDYLAGLGFKSKPNDWAHEELTSLFRKYLLVGGMPAVVKNYIEDPYATTFQDTQLLLLQTYRDDFGKYASQVKVPHLQKMFNAVPTLAGKIFKYSQVDAEVQSRELKLAVQLLSQAGVLTKVVATSGHGLPLLANANEKKFKLIFLDVGLMQRACGMATQLALNPDFMAINAGAIAEQVVGQQLIAGRAANETSELYFWVREKQGSQAEVDYLVVLGEKVIPIEVKSGTTGRLKSLKIFMEEHGSALALRISQHPLSYHENILTIPVYAMEHWQSLAARASAAASV